MRSLFIVLLMLSFFQNAHAESATPCADSLLMHLDSKQPFTNLGYVKEALSKRESATLLLKMTLNATRAPMNDVLTLGLPPSGPVHLFDQFTVIDRDFHFVIDGASADLTEAAAAIQQRYPKAEFGFQIIGSRSATQTFDIQFPTARTLELNSTEEGYASLEQHLRDEKETARSVYLEDLQVLAFVFPWERLNALTPELFQKLGISVHHVSKGQPLGEYLTKNAGQLRESSIISYNDHIVVSQPAFFALKKLSAQPFPAAPPTDVQVSEIFERELAKCKAASCEVVTPTEVTQLFAIAFKGPPAPVVHVSYLVLPPSVELQAGDVDAIGELLRLVGDGKLPREAEGIRQRFLDLLDRVDPQAHELHVQQLAGLNFGASDLTNGRAKSPSQNRLLTGVRMLADALHKESNPERPIGPAGIREALEAFRSLVGPSNGSTDKTDKPKRAAKPAPAVPPATEAAYPVFAQDEVISNVVIGDTITDTMRAFAGGVPMGADKVRDAWVTMLDLLNPAEHERHVAIMTEIGFSGSDMNNGRIRGSAQNRLLAGWRALTDAVLGTHEARRPLNEGDMRDIAAQYAALVKAAGEPAQPPPEPPVPPPVKQAEAPAPPAPPASPFRLNLKPVEFDSTGWIAQRKGELLFAADREAVVWGPRPLTLINKARSPYFVGVQMHYARSTSPANAVAMLVENSKVPLPSSMRALAERALTDPSSVETIPVNATFSPNGSTKLEALNKANLPFFITPKDDLKKPIEQRHLVLMIPVLYADAGGLVAPGAPAAESKGDSAATPVSAIAKMDAYLKRQLRFALPDGPNRVKLVYADGGRAKMIGFAVNEGEIVDKNITHLQPDDEKRFWETVGKEQRFDAMKYDLGSSQTFGAAQLFSSIYLASNVVARATVKAELDEESIEKLVSRIEWLEADGQNGYVSTVKILGRAYVIKAVVQDRRLIILDVGAQD